MKSIIISLASIATFVFLFVGFTQVTNAVDPFSDVCSGGSNRSTTCINKKSSTSNPLLGPNGIITNVIQVLVIIIGAASVIMVMIGGLKYIISSGDPAKVSNAKDTILYALIGLVVAILAQSIVSFVLIRL